ncbi:MAG: hypothetical protein Q7T55_20770 [Solirubrobacteraceae bacterium]|nr:hypothetical protein [Solirubrobacteraceae bacterium]
MSRFRVRTPLLIAAGLLALPGAANAAVPRTETPIVSSSPQTDVASSYVSIKVPLPSSAAAHPEKCDWLSYLRFRSTTGPAESMKADAVTVLMPGIMEGASAFDPLARNAVRAAKRRGRNIEVWALDRRSNCLEDLTGLNEYERTGDAKDATNYYFGGAPAGGKTFAGWNVDDRFLADIGMEQTVQDYNAVLVNELPSQPWRESHVLCGGHSLGGPITQLFAGWDFDGDAKTTVDAGYRQCAAFVGFESMLDLDLVEDSPQLKAAIGFLTLGQTNFLRRVSVSALKSGKVPRHFKVGGLDPMSTMFMEAVGIGASKRPNDSATPFMKSVPVDKEGLDSYLHLTGSVDLPHLIASKDSLRDYSYTNAGLLGQLFDDNGAVFSGIRASFGYFNGSPMRISHLADQVKNIPGINIAFQQAPLMLPFKAKAGTPATGWANYDALGSGATQIGAGRTDASTEVTDARDFARIQYEGPTNFTETYMPTRLMTDFASLIIGDRTQDLKGFRYKHPTRLKPRMVALGTSGAAKKAKLGSPDPFVMMTGYEHVDAITAAEKQNDGKPEGSSTMLVDMIDRVVPR